MRDAIAITLWTLLIGPVWAQDPFAVDPFLAAAPVQPTYAECFAAAQRTHSPFVALFTTDSCVACEQQKSLFAAADLHGVLFCRVHSSHGRLCAEAKVAEFPTTLIFWPDGHAARFVGLTATEKVLARLRGEAKPRPFESTRAISVRNADGSSSRLLAITPTARTRTFARPAGQAGCIVNG